MLLVSPMLAQTLGLEEALLLQLLQETAVLQGQAVTRFNETQRQTLLPFWSSSQFQAVLRRLQAQGVIEIHAENPWQILCQLPDISEAVNVKTPVTKVNLHTSELNQVEPANPRESNTSQAVPVYSMNDNINDVRRRNQYEDDLAYLKPETPSKPAIRARKSKMHSNWEPSADFPGLLSFHDVPLQFALSELAKFRQYYQPKDRTEISWDVPFLNWVQRAWRNSMNTKGRHDQQNADGESTDPTRTKRTRVRDALRNIQDTDW